MGHTFLSLDMSLIPQSTKDNVPTFWLGMFSSDKTRMLLDGYNEDRNIVHSEYVLMFWLQWEENPQATFQLLMDTAIEYTKEEIQAGQQDHDSIWYIEPSEEL